MLKISDRLDRMTMAAGEPLILGLRFRDKDSDDTLDMIDRRFALVFYLASGRGDFATIDGVAANDGSGAFFRFIRDGIFSESLRGQSVRFDLVERTLNSRETIATGAVTVTAGAGAVVSYGDMIGHVETRLTLYVDDNGVVMLPARQSQLRYRPDGAPPYFSTPVSIASDGTPQVGETLTGVDGVVVNGTITGRQWLLAGVPITGETQNAFTPQQVGNYTFRVTVTGTDGTTTTGSSTAAVLAADTVPDPLTITGTPPTTGTVGQSYSFTPSAAGGAGTKVYALASGTLLAGLSLNTSTGAITGTPTAAGTMTGLSVRVTDDTGSASTAPTTVTIAAASPGAAWAFDDTSITFDRADVYFDGTTGSAPTPRSFFSDPFFSDPFFRTGA